MWEVEVVVVELLDSGPLDVDFRSGSDLEDVIF